MRILLVEDDSQIASFVLRGLKEAGFAVDHAGDGQTGLSMATANEYDALIVDLMIPQIDGLSLIETLRGQGHETPILILSAKGSVGDKVRGFESGSDDYVTKPFSFAELLARLQALIRRASRAGGGTSRLSVGDLELDLLARTVCRGGVEVDLQPREFSLLEYLMRNAGNVVSKTMILEHVWDYHFDPQTNVVDVLIHRLRSKIDKDFDEKLLHTVRGVGYVLKPR